MFKCNCYVKQSERLNEKYCNGRMHAVLNKIPTMMCLAKNKQTTTTTTKQQHTNNNKNNNKNKNNTKQQQQNQEDRACVVRFCSFIYIIFLIFLAYFTKQLISISQPLKRIRSRQITLSLSLSFHSLCTPPPPPAQIYICIHLS